jgi:protein TonB
MPYLRDRADRKKAIVMVAALHAALGVGLVLGLAGDPVRQVTDRLRSSAMVEPLTIEQLDPPPPPRQAQAPAPRDEAAPPNLRARPAPIVAPPALRPLPVRSPVRTSERRAPVVGADRTAGAAAVAGPGTGAGGSGDGFGGGGLGGEGAGGGGGMGSPPRLLGGNSARVSQRLLQRFAVNRGEALLALTIGAHGRVTACAPIRGSGNGELDVELCQLMLSRSRWVPALDGSGRPISAQLQYTATWNRY